MFEIRKTFTAPELPASPSFPDPEKVLFFDIETTGLSPMNSAIYLIGGCFRRDGQWHLRQWFSESLSDEIPVLREFSAFLDDFSTLVHYNGDTFDLPYLKAVYAQYHLKQPFDRLHSVDLLKSARRIRSLLDPVSLKQKDVEAALGILREDVYSGAELIQVYKDWQSCPDDQRLHDLLLHNEDDIKGLLQILPILFCDGILTGQIRPLSLRAERIPERQMIRLEAAYPVRLPFRRTLDSSDGLTVSFREDRAELEIPLVHKELKKFLPEPKKYYYLPNEDMVIPRELGSGVDPSRRVPAKKETCYVKCEDDFIRAYAPDKYPAFRDTYAGKERFYRLCDVDWEEYFEDFLSNVLTSRPGHGIDKSNR